MKKGFDQPCVLTSEASLQQIEEKERKKREEEEARMRRRKEREERARQKAEKGLSAKRKLEERCLENEIDKWLSSYVVSSVLQASELL